MIKNILEYFEKTVEKHSGKVAVIDGERQITFYELASNAWAAGNAIYKKSNGLMLFFLLFGVLLF